MIEKTDTELSSVDHILWVVKIVVGQILRPFNRCSFEIFFFCTIGLYCNISNTWYFFLSPIGICSEFNKTVFFSFI